MEIIDGIPVWGKVEEGALRHMKVSMQDPRAVRAVLCADNHQGYMSMPVGGVIAYQKEYISPSAVGVDVACGNCAVRLGIKEDDIRGDLELIADEIWSTISFGVGQKNNEVVDDPLYDDDPAWQIRTVHSLKQMARNQLGTIGGGNHFCIVSADENHDIWVGTHFGSRGFGNKIAKHYIEQGGGKDGVDSPPVVLGSSSYLGSEYIAAMNLAARYAYAGRDWVCDRIAKILGGDILDRVHNNHNLAWLETHGGEDFWVIRKGATPANPGQRGFIGGTMGDISVIIEGIDTQENIDTLRSTVHGAGRIMSRTQAAGRKHFDKKTKQMVRDGKGKISREDMMQRLEKYQVVLRGGDTDEAPQCYKPIEEVLDAHLGSIKILHTLRPMVCLMAGPTEWDPFKD